MTESLRYSNYEIVFQEAPDEVSLAINITGCRFRCPGCHSPYLQRYFGNLLLEDLEGLISRYSGMITCVIFMGGDQNLDELGKALKIVKAHSLKTCVYSGVESAAHFADVMEDLDYVKVGQYDAELGGLDSQTTNQRFYWVKNGEKTDITCAFTTKEIT